MGECRESLFLSGLQKSDEFGCLDYCKSGNTFTFGLIELSAPRLPLCGLCPFLQLALHNNGTLNETYV